MHAPPAGGNSPTPSPTKAAAIKPTIINGPPIRVRSRQAVASANDDDVVVIKPKDTSDPVVGVFRDMFGLFGSSNDSQQPVKKKRRSGNVQLAPDGEANSESPVIMPLRRHER